MANDELFEYTLHGYTWPHAYTKEYKHTHPQKPRGCLVEHCLLNEIAFHVGNFVGKYL